MSSIPISRTKIIVPPRRPELLSRPRLVESMLAARERKLILVTAPAGYGKTTLLIDLAHSAPLPVCWLALDQYDRDPQRFLAYLIAALVEKFPLLEAPLRAQFEQLKTINTDAEPLLVNLSNELYEQVDQDFLLILDDYHLLEDVPIISSLMTRFLQLVDDNCHVVISSRTLVPLPDLPAMVVHDQVEGLDHTQLAFNPGEVQALFDQNHHRHLSNENARQLVTQTGGWITGVLLSDLSGGGRVSGVDAYAYLGQQVLDLQPEPLRTFLLRTSIPEEFDAELCETALSQFHEAPQKWADLLQQVLARNLFVQPVGEGGRWLRYHPLFREFLQSRFEVEKPQELRPLLHKLVMAYEQKEDWEKAYYTCQLLNDPPALAEVIERAGPAMILYALITVENWINGLPPSLVRSRPGLISLRGFISMEKGNVQDALNFYNQAESAYQEDSRSAGLALTLIRRATCLRYLGKYSAALQDLEQALELSEPQDELQTLFADALRVKGVILHRLGQSRQAINCLEHSLALFTALNKVDRIPILLMDTGMVQLEIGDLQTARNSYLRALEIWQAENNLQWQASLLNNLGVLYHQLGDYELSSKAYEDGLHCALKSRQRRREALILTGLGDLYTEVEEYETAALAYLQAEAIALEINDSFIQNYLTLASAHLAVRLDNPTKARQILDENNRRLLASPSSYERGLKHLIEGRIYIHKDLPADAMSSLQQAKSCFEEDGRDLETMWSRIWLACALNLNREREAARSELREQFASQGQNEHAMLVCLAQAARWLESLRSDPEIGRSLGSQLEKAARVASRLPAARRALRHLAEAIQIPSAHLSIRAFGHAEVQVNGKNLTMSDWHTQAVRNLLFYFLVEYRPVTKEQIGAAMWPEIEDARTLQTRFRNEMHRLRRAVGREAIVYVDESYRFNRALDYEYDVDKFESMLARARSARGEADCIEYFKKAVDLVSGPYLPDVDNMWADEERARLRHTHLAALEELAGLYLNAGQINEAVEICRLALQLEPGMESISRLLIQSYAALADKPNVTRAYQACEQALKKMGYTPSEETRLLYRQLMGADPPSVFTSDVKRPSKK